MRLLFPEGVDDLVVPRALVGTELVEAAVAKISRYLHNGKNDAYAEAKLVSLIKGGDVLVRQSMEDVTMRPKKAAAAVLSPNDFTFKFWTHLSNLVLQDFRKKKEKTAEDQGCCQSAYIVGLHGLPEEGGGTEGAGARGRQEEPGDHRAKAAVRLRLRGDVRPARRQGRDASSPSTRGSSSPRSSRRRRSTGAESPCRSSCGCTRPRRARTSSSRGTCSCPSSSRSSPKRRGELREGMINEWVELLRRDKAAREMKSDRPSRRSVEARVKEDYPFLAALASGPLLSLARTDTNIAAQAAEEIGKCLSAPGVLRPFAELLGLSRAKLLRDARSYLPFWQTTPIIRGIVKFFRMLFEGRPGRARKADTGQGEQGEQGGQESPRPGAKPAAGSDNASLAYQRAVQSLRSQYVPPGKTIDETLAELAEKWNPLYAAEQKRHLVEDVNSLVRDYLRPVRGPST